MRELSECEICKNKEIKLSFKQEDKNLNIPKEFSIYRCDRCGLLFLNPQPSYKELKRHYSKEKYYSLKGIEDKNSKKTRFRILLYDIYFNREKITLSKRFYSLLLNSF
jgi:hypothetical protein